LWVREARVKTALYREVEALIGGWRPYSFPGLCEDLARAVGVPSAADAYDQCGLVGVVIVCAEVLGEDAPSELQFMAARLLADQSEYGYPGKWWDSYDRVLAACRLQRESGLSAQG
jgi:hypothetical protein